MKLQLAPLEGITNYIYRNAYHHHFQSMDVYYIPFISLSGEKVFNYKEKAELAPENNAGMHVIPQVITNSASDVLSVENKFKAMGYEEMNINLGCPSGTVTPKGRGSGMLKDPLKLDSFLAEIFERTSAEISLKTRLGYDNADEWEDLLKIYNKYPASELIVHARVRTDFYKNTVNLDAFECAVNNSKNPLCYNGDIYTVEDYLRLKKRFPELESVMLGRGILTNPFLAEEIREAEKRLCTIKEQIGSQDDFGKEAEQVLSDYNQKPFYSCADDVKRLEAFHDEVFNNYKAILSGDKNLMFKMKEFWHYMIHIFPDWEKHDKRIKKMTNSAEYSCYVKGLFASLR